MCAIEVERGKYDDRRESQGLQSNFAYVINQITLVLSVYLPLATTVYLCLYLCLSQFSRLTDKSLVLAMRVKRHVTHNNTRTSYLGLSTRIMFFLFHFGDDGIVHCGKIRDLYMPSLALFRFSTHIFSSIRTPPYDCPRTKFPEDMHIS